MDELQRVLAEHRDPAEIVTRVAEIPYPFPSEDRVPELFAQLVERVESGPRRGDYLMYRFGVSFLSPMISRSFDGVRYLIDSERFAEFPPDDLSTIFTGDLRMKCKRIHKDRTPLELWKDPNHQLDVFEDAMEYHQDKNGVISAQGWRQSHAWKSGECTNFPLTIALGVYQWFNAHDILDISAGWGDRAIAAAAWNKQASHPVSYTGLDPNPALAPRYDKMFDMLAPDAKFSFITTPAEDWEPPEKAKYDLIFTSPPYFNLETFAEGEDAKTQSTERYPNDIAWVRKFIIPALNIAWGRLRVGGNLVLSIEDSIGKREKTLYTEAIMLIIASEFSNARWRGILATKSAGNTHARPLFCFEKLGYPSRDQVNAAARDLREKWSRYA